MNSDFILNILRRRHTRDFFLAEVKNGPTHGVSNLIRLDAWALKLSWKQHAIGYEIKVNRSDFVSDQKWNQYLNYCNQFYWVCPTGLINVDEIDPRCGLIYVNENGSHRVVRRAIYRDINIPSDIYRYVIMWRLSNENPQKTRKDLIEEYINDKKDSHFIGNYFKSKLIAELNDVKNKLSKLEFTIFRWKDIIDNHTPSDINELIKNKGNDIDIVAIEHAKILLERQLMRIKK